MEQWGTQVPIEGLCVHLVFSLHCQGRDGQVVLLGLLSS